MKLDFHYHLANAEGAVEELIADMDKAEVDITLLMGGPEEAFWEFKNCSFASNEKVLEAVKKYPDRLVGNVYIDPREVDAIETLNLYMDKGFKAVKMFPPVGKKQLNPSLYHAGGGHCVDTIRYLMNDEIVECTALVSNLNYPSCETEAETLALYRFKNGQIGKVMSLVLKPVASFEFNLDLYGTKGTFKNNKLTLDSMPKFNDPTNKDNQITYPEWMPDNTVGVTEPWDVEICQFVDWVLGVDEGKELCKAKDAIRVAEACWAAVISSEEHRVVTLPLVDLD